MIADNSKIYSNVRIGKNVVIEDFCIIGKPPLNTEDGELETVIGDNSIIRSHTVIYSGNLIAGNFTTGHHVVVRESNVIGKGVSLGTGSCIEHHIRIEDGVRLHSQTFIPEFTTLKRNAWIGPNVVFTNAKYPLGDNVKSKLEGPVIGEDVIVGANSTILPGVKIDKSSIIGAGSVVTRDVPEEAVVYGNPAKVKKSVNHLMEYTNRKNRKV